MAGQENIMKDSINLPGGGELERPAYFDRLKIVCYKIEIPGRLPSLNEYIDEERKNRFRAAKIKSEKQYYVGLWIRKSHPGLKITTPVYITYYWYEPNRRRDKSNVCAYGRKVIEDALVAQGVLKDDGWEEIEGFHDVFFVDKDNPRIEVWIYTCSDTTTNGAGNTTAKTASASHAPGTTTSTKATSGAASGMDDSARSGKGHARTTSGKAKTSRSKGRKRNR